MLENCDTTLRELAGELNIAYETAQQTAIDILGMRCVAVRLIPKGLSFVHKHHRRIVTEDLISKAKNIQLTGN